jgi:hypothetical protein
MSGKCLGKALRFRDGAFKRIGRASPQHTFSSSAVCQKHGNSSSCINRYVTAANLKIGAVPKFAETSSPELDAILSTYRLKVILPAHLSKQQQDLIYKKKNQKVLSVEPITARIGDEDFRLEHIDRPSDLPNIHKDFIDTIKLMKDKRDWDQVPPLLQGLKNAGRDLKKRHIQGLFRKAALAGRMDVMLECVRRVAHTGIRLNDPDLVAAFMWGIQYKVIVSNFAERETKQALSWAEMVLVMLEEERHTGTLEGVDPRTVLEVVGAPLQLAAVRASRHLDGKDEDGIVAKYAEMLLRTSLNTQPPLLPSIPFTHRNKIWIRKIFPTLHGMTVAQTILDPTSEVAKQLKDTTDTLQASFDAQLDFIKETGEGGTFWTEMYHKLMTEKA